MIALNGRQLAIMIAIKGVESVASPLIDLRASNTPRALTRILARVLITAQNIGTGVTVTIVPSRQTSLLHRFPASGAGR
jgi:hypothetical protein